VHVDVEIAGLERIVLSVGELDASRNRSDTVGRLGHQRRQHGTAAHIHMAKMGKNGRVAVPLPA
jgi:hypothetical protein